RCSNSVPGAAKRNAPAQTGAGALSWMAGRLIATILEKLEPAGAAADQVDDNALPGISVLDRLLEWFRTRDLLMSYFREHIAVLDAVCAWGFWSEPVWALSGRRDAGRWEVGWKVALMDVSGLPKSREQCEWFYRRSGTSMRSPFLLHSGWFETGFKEYLAPNLV